MADNNYWSTNGDQGSIRISEEVVASVASIAVTETAGVSSLCTGLPADIASLLGKKNWTKGTKITFEDNSVMIEISILVTYGVSVLQVATTVQTNVRAAVESMTGLSVKEVNVRVCGVSFPPTPTDVSPSTQET